MNIEELLSIVRPACACGATAVTTFNGLAVCRRCHEVAAHHWPETKPEPQRRPEAA